MVREAGFQRAESRSLMTCKGLPDEAWRFGMQPSAALLAQRALDLRQPRSKARWSAGRVRILRAF